jgi:HEAT repeat protein
MRIVAGRDPETRRAAVEALGMLRAVEAVDALAAAAHDANEPLQLAAIQALKNIGGLKAGGKVRSVLETGKKAVREAAAGALSSMPFESASPEDRAAGATLRGDFEAALREGPAAAGVLAAALSSRDAGYRLKAVCAMGSLRSEPVVASLLRALDDYDREVREAAAAQLAGIGTAAVSGLVELLSSERASLRALAASALEKIGDPGSAGALAEAIAAGRRAPPDDSESRVATEAAARALLGVLSKSAASVPPDSLRRIVGMPAPKSAGWNDVQDLARREMLRRGISEVCP